MIRICCQDQLATPGSVDGSSGHFATNYFKRTFLGYTCVTTWHVTARSTYTPQFDSLVVSVYSASFRVISVTSPNTCDTPGTPLGKIIKPTGDVIAGMLSAVYEYPDLIASLG